VDSAGRVQHVDRPFREPVHEDDAIADDRDLGGHRENLPFVQGSPGQRELGHRIRQRPKRVVRWGRVVRSEGYPQPGYESGGAEGNPHEETHYSSSIV